jgi:hypothetical protein
MTGGGTGNLPVGLNPRADRPAVQNFSSSGACTKIRFPQSIQRIHPTGKSPESRQSRPIKIFCFSEMANHPTSLAILSQQEGRYAIVTFAGRAAVDADGA